MSGDNKWTIIHDLPPKGFVKAIRDQISKALLEMARLWHDRFLPRHFEPGAEAKYGYQERVESYLKKKMRKHGHNMPLVFSGRLRSELTSNVMYQVTRTKVKATLQPGFVGTQGKKATTYSIRKKLIRGMSPKWLKGFLMFSTGRSTLPDYKKEILALANDERKELTEMWGQNFRKAIWDKAASSKRKITI